MKTKATCFVLSALFILLGNSLALAVIDPKTGEEKPGPGKEKEVVAEEVSGEPSGEISTSGEDSR